MATIGRASAIAQVRSLPRLKGFPAWFIWVTVHVALLLGSRNRFATMTNLSLKYLLWRSHNAIVGETPYVIAQEPKIVSGSEIESVPAKKAAKARKAISKKAQVRKAVAQQTLDEIDDVKN